MKFVTAYNDHRSVELGPFDFREPNPWRVDRPTSVSFNKIEELGRQYNRARINEILGGNYNRKPS